MAYSVCPTRAFERQLREALEYLAVELSNPGAASVLLDSVERQFALLASMPYAYPVDEALSERSDVTRRAPARGCRTPYSVDDQAKTVHPRVLRHVRQGVTP